MNARAVVSLALPPGKSEQAALEAVLDALAPVFEGATLVDGERAGALLVLSEDAGSATAVQFWRDALATGPALASPGAFPWCLANAPCATIARRFALTGPNLTWLCTSNDAADAFDAPAAWLAEHLSAAGAPAWLVALRFAAPAARVQVWSWQAETARPAPQAELRASLVREWAAPLTQHA